MGKLPDDKALAERYHTLGVKAVLADVDVPMDAVPELLRCSPMVRNRLTLMRLQKCIR